MYSLQLLRILQTLPSDMKYETCVFDSVEQNMNMKENQNVTFYDSKSFGKEADPLVFGGEEIYQLNGSRRGNDPIAFEVNAREGHWNTKIEDNISNDDESGAIDSPRKEDSNELSHLRGRERDADSLSSEIKDKEKLQSSPALELSNFDEFMHFQESESRDSGSLLITASDLFETGTDLYTDKNVLECELPELSVCNKEINYHIVKDICVDEGMPTKDEILIESCSDYHSGLSVSQPPHDQCDGTEGGINNELITSLENTKSDSENECGNLEVGENECENIEVSDDKLLAHCSPKLPSESSFDKDTAKNCDREDSMQTGEANCGATGNIAIDVSEEESFVESKLPIQEFGTRSFLRSFLNTLDDEGNKDVQPLDQISPGKEVSESPASVSVEAEPKEDNQPTNILYNSKVESGSITFNFNYPAPEVSSITNGITENVKEQSVESGDVHDHTDGNANNISETKLVQCSSIKDSSIGDVPERSLDIKNGNSDNFSDTSQVQYVSSKGMRNKIDRRESFDSEDINSNDLSANGEVQFASSKSLSIINDDCQAVEPHVMKHELKNSDDVSVVRPLQYDEGESSFSAAGLITFSGPIAYSGSLSLRSDGSATSGRSFAFPILQSEWNSSPVRMAKADRRHFRKHKGWRLGLLCCRF